MSDQLYQFHSTTIGFAAPVFPTLLSLALLCPHCGDLWARVRVQGVEWLPVLRACQPCGGGSFFLSPQFWPQALPPVVLYHELRVYLESFPSHRSPPCPSTPIPT